MVHLVSRDAQPEVKTANEVELREVTLAYEWLSDPQKRQDYDGTRDVNYAAALLYQMERQDAEKASRRERAGLGVEHVLERWEHAASSGQSQSSLGSAALTGTEDYETRMIALQVAMEKGEMASGDGRDRRRRRHERDARARAKEAKEMRVEERDERSWFAEPPKHAQGQGCVVS